MKFPRTRRDLLINEHRREEAEHQRCEDQTDGNERKNQPLPERGGYPEAYQSSGKKNHFDREAFQPLGTNAESWANLRDSRAPSNINETYAEEDDVFVNNDDMRRMRLGMTDPNSSYYLYPGAYATIARLGGVPEESHFGQGLEHFGPGYQIGASCTEIFFSIWNILMYLLDIGSDIYLSYLYFKHEHYAWFGLTLAFVIIPAVSMSIFSLMLYLKDRKLGAPQSRCCWASRIIFIVLQVAPLIRMFETLIYGCKSRDPDKEVLKRRRYYDAMVNEDTDAMLLRLFESFMEAAPQLVLQLYIITQIGTDDGTFLVVVQVFGLVTSLISLAGCLVSFQKSLRLSQPEKEKLRFPGMLLMFLWRMFTLTARIFALAMFASYFKYWIFMVVGVHWLAMLIWIAKQDTQYCGYETPEGKIKVNRAQEMGFRFLCAFVYIFCFFNLIEGHTRLRAILYYSIAYAENAIIVMAWYIAASMKTTTSWYFTPVLIIVLCGFWFGILFQAAYYKFYHPNNNSVLNTRKRILCCVPYKFLSLTLETHFLAKPPGSVMHRSQLSLNQTGLFGQGHNMSYPEFNANIMSTPAASMVQIDDPNRRTPVPMYTTDPNAYPSERSYYQAEPSQYAPSERYSMLTDRSLNSRPTSFNSIGQPRRIVQKKWQPSERPAAGHEKLNMSMDSGSTSTGAGSFRYKSSTPESRAQRRAQRAAKKQRNPQLPVPENQEPLPMHLRDQPQPAQRAPNNHAMSRIHTVQPVQQTPPVLKMASLPKGNPPPNVEPDDLEDEESYSESEHEDEPLTGYKASAPIMEEDEGPDDDYLEDEDELPPEAHIMKVSAI